MPVRTKFPSRKPRRQFVKAISALSARQLDEVRHWFIADPILTFQNAGDRIAREFGVRINQTALRIWWHETLGPLVAPPPAGVVELPASGLSLELTATVRHDEAIISTSTFKLPLEPTEAAA